MSTPTTQALGTVTTEGWIPHVRHPDLGIWMPVRLAPVADGEPRTGFPTPMRRKGKLVFALPGGREFTPSAV